MWEYHSFAMGPNESSDATLAELGNQGWELIAVLFQPENDRYSETRMFYLKRRKEVVIRTPMIEV